MLRKIPSKTLLRLFSNEIKPIDPNTPVTPNSAVFPTGPISKPEIKIEKLETKEIPKLNKPESTNDESKENSHRGPSKISVFVAGILVGLVAYVYTRRNFSLRFSELTRRLHDVQDVKTTEQEDIDALDVQDREIYEMIKKRRSALKGLSESSLKFEDLLVLKAQRYWNELLFNLGNVIASTNQASQKREEARIRQRIMDEAASQGYTDVEIKKISK